FALAASRKGVFRHYEIAGGRIGRPWALLERDSVGGLRSADGGEIISQRVDELLLAERIGPGRLSLGGAARHLLDDTDPIFLAAPIAACGSCCIGKTGPSAGRCRGGRR